LPDAKETVVDEEVEGGVLGAGREVQVPNVGG